MSEVEIYCIKSSFISANVWLLNTKSSIKPLKLKEMTNLPFSHLHLLGAIFRLIWQKSV